MAESGSWPSIKERGLLSTSAILDLYDVTGDDRRKIEETRRPVKVTLSRETLPPMVIRDQIPMNDSALCRCLLDGLAPRKFVIENRHSNCPYAVSEGRPVAVMEIFDALERQAARKPPDKDARSMCRCFRREMVRHRFFRRSLALLDSVAEILPRSTNSRLTSDVALESFSASRSDWFGGRSCPFVGIRPAVECHENHFGGTASVCSRADFVLPLSSEAAFTLRIIGLPCPLGKTRASTGSDSSAEIRRALTSPRR
jgi:hypothetical protein